MDYDVIIGRNLYENDDLVSITESNGTLVRKVSGLIRLITTTDFDGDNNCEIGVFAEYRDKFDNLLRD